MVTACPGLAAYTDTFTFTLFSVQTFSSESGFGLWRWRLQVQHVKRRSQSLRENEASQWVSGPGGGGATEQIRRSSLATGTPSCKTPAPTLLDLKGKRESVVTSQIQLLAPHGVTQRSSERFRDAPLQTPPPKTRQTQRPHETASRLPWRRASVRSEAIWS